jgi:dTDP-4-dehydrorhamnose 3,5-epimerase
MVFSYGNAQVVLHGLRGDTAIQGETNLFYMGEGNRMLFVIPVRVAHGYRVLGNEPAVIVYFSTMSYDPKNPDEKRIR